MTSASGTQQLHVITRAKEPIMAPQRKGAHMGHIIYSAYYIVQRALYECSATATRISLSVYVL